ncbi:uncharacterized protein ATC70_011128 [Mucor velutinosus]|uniref:Reverse transcriptase domain-containing protein n=1 Tax=Mucor velutinosus TaxID=708070 RepID=A0AAN7DFS6_9FUNG|nr:hypothetical protein ATC70_011128 [Mucor velutinosus]
MGLKNSGAQWMLYLMNDVLEYLDDFVICYIDGCLIYTKDNDLEFHKKYLHMVLFKKLQEDGRVMSKAKCKFSRKEIILLGQNIVAGQVIKLSQKKVDAIASWPVPKTV